MQDGLKQVAFRNGSIDMAGNLYFPSGFNENGTYAALVIATPGSSVKEQIGGTYAAKLAEKGFVVLTFDPSYQGQSGGEPSDLEDPAARVEDIRCAIDYLMTLPYVAEERVGLLGICAGGGYAVNAALTEHRFKALGVVVPVNIGRARRRASPEEIRKNLAEVGKQRTAEARGAAPRRVPWIPDTLEQAREAGIEDPDVLAAVEYYRTPIGYNGHSTNRLYFKSFGLLASFDAFHLVPELLTQPLQVIVAGRRGTTFSYDDGHDLFESAPNQKDFFVVEGAGHYDMYYKAPYVDQAVDRLASFYAQHLGD